MRFFCYNEGKGGGFVYKAVLVGANLNSGEMMDYYMEELQNLAIASNLEVVYSLTQNINSVTPNFYIGKGKVDEIKKFVSNLDADMVIFNNELSGSQIRNLEEALNCRVVDRTLLILDIFAKRAKTREAMLQVEIAQLEYLRTRLVGMRDSLNRQQGGIGSRGPGEKKLELDKRRIDHERIKLKDELKDIVKARKIQRRNRNKSKIKKVAIVGYTNAGKSTLLNSLIDYTEKDLDKQVYAKDMLFATLETSTRHITLGNHKDFVITDTVGFVSNLPHNLVESFKSTLEEITEADFLIHVVDTSNEYHEQQIKVTNQTLEEIGVHDIPTLYIYNKFDLLEIEIKPSNFPNVIVSLIEKEGIEQVISFLNKELFKEYEVVELLIPYDKGDLVSYLNENNNVLSQEYNDNGTVVTVELTQIQKGRYRDYLNQ
jgi:GTP-binding protein HflX